MAQDKNKLLAMSTNPGENPGAGTKYVSHLVLYLVGGFVVFFMVVVFIVGFGKNNPAGDKAETPKVSDGTRQAEEITQSQKNALVPEALQASATQKEEKSGLGVQSAIDTKSEEDVPRLKVASPPPKPDRTPYGEELVRIQGLKMQLFDQALQSKTSVPSPSQRRLSPGVDTPSREEMLAQIAVARQHMDTYNTDTTQAYKARMEQIRTAGLGGVETSASLSGSFPVTLDAGSNRNSLSNFDSSRAGDRWTLGDSRITAPKTPYDLRAGFVIPAIMISGVNSDLPGQVIAQVNQHVYDSATGNFLVIPQGTRLVGSYSADVAYGQARIMMAWQRLIFPDGKALDLGAMPGTDGAGYAGFSDQIDNHYFRTFTSAFLMSGVVAGVTLSQPNNDSNSNSQRAGDALSEALGQSLGSAMAAMLQKNLNIAPTLQIRPGYRFNVMVVKDIPFPQPYRPFDYNREKRGGL
jgi:type IV secretion system protein VirB10